MSDGVALTARLILIFLLVSICVLVRFPGRPGQYLNVVAREVNKRGLLLATLHLDSREGAHFIVRYAPGYTRAAAMALEAAEGFYPRIATDFGVTIPGKIPILIYPNMADLNRSFGWPADESTMGVYWAGTIRVVAPEVWLDEAEPSRQAEVFRQVGPMAHEIAHLFVDHLTCGNCPRWFNEGVAQYEEYRLTGFRFGPPDEIPSGAYTLDDLHNFDYLPDQNLAYRQTYSMVSYLADEVGWWGLVAVLQRLGRGETLDQALLAVAGWDTVTWEKNWQRWLGQERAHYGNEC